MKPLLPSLREKNRYVVYKVVSHQPLDFHLVKDAVLKACYQFMGQLHAAKAGLMVLDEWKYNQGIIKVNHKYLDELQASLLFIESIQGKPLFVESVGVSGALNKAKLKFMKKGGT